MLYWTKSRKVCKSKIIYIYMITSNHKPVTKQKSHEFTFQTDALHKSRLLNVEERPFKRITKRLLTPNSLIATPPTLPPTPPPDSNALDEAAAAHEAEKQQQVEEHRQWREDVLLDFAAFESSIVRIQFLLTSNIKERERYAAEKLTIEATAQAVRENTAELRLQLEEAQRTLATRKEYDELAEKITNNRLLRPREDQHANLQKLGAEIAELERESQDYANTWAERRDQFGRIIEEGMQLRRLIRDEKEEVERREGMEERDDGDDGDAGFQPDHMSGQATPVHGDGGSTPSHVNQDRDRDRSRGRSPAGGGRLLVERHATPGGKSPLRHARGVDEDDSPEGEVRVEEDEEREEEDTDMAEDGELSGEGEPIAMPSEGLLAAPDAPETNGRTPATDHMDVS
jgi:hypothetical protein